MALLATKNGWTDSTVPPAGRNCGKLSPDPSHLARPAAMRYQLPGGSVFVQPASPLFAPNSHIYRSQSQKITCQPCEVKITSGRVLKGIPAKLCRKLNFSSPDAARTILSIFTFGKLMQEEIFSSMMVYHHVFLNRLTSQKVSAIGEH